MDQGKPLTTFLVTALALWAIYLWKHGRLGKTALPARRKRRAVHGADRGRGQQGRLPEAAVFPEVDRPED